MPIENEFKFCLTDAEGDLEARLRAGDDVRTTDILQGYLNDDTRIRRLSSLDDGAVRYVFSYKHKVCGRSIEIETDISEADFRALWPERSRGLKKRRISFQEGDIHWDVDFFKASGGRGIYFVMAEAEVAETVSECPGIADRLADNLLHVAGAQRGFSSRRLCNEAYARDLMKILLSKKAELDAGGMRARPMAMAS